MAAEAVLAPLRAALAGTGIDLLQPFAVQAYNRAVAGHARLGPLETFARPGTLAVLLGNTRALWEPLLAACAADPGLRESRDPVDDYVQDRVLRAAAATGLPHAVCLGRERSSELSLLHAAQASGFAQLGPAHLAVHSELGPWFGLRAVLVFDAAWEAPPTAARAVCQGCAAPCQPTLAEALTAHAAAGGGSIAGHWRAWLAVRDACPVGRAHRYGEAQLVYHYTKDLTVLRGG